MKTEDLPKHLECSFNRSTEGFEADVAPGGAASLKAQVQWSGRAAVVLSDASFF